MPVARNPHNVELSLNLFHERSRTGLGGGIGGARRRGERLRLHALTARQVRRAVFGIIAAVFGVAVLALAEVAGWQALRLKVEPIPATLILLGINLVVAAVFGVLAARSVPGVRVLPR